MGIINERVRSFESRSQLTAISSLIKEERATAGYTQAQLALAIGINLKTLRKMEQGDHSVRLDSVDRVLNYFGYELRPGKLVSEPTKVSKDDIGIEEILKRIRTLLPIFESKFQVHEMGVFGSYVNCPSDELKKGDIDILVSFKVKPSITEFSQMHLILSNVFDGRRIDLIDSANLREDLKESIYQDLIRVEKEV